MKKQSPTYRRLPIIRNCPVKLKVLYTWICLHFKADYYTYQSEITLEGLSKVTGIKDRDKLSLHTKLLAEYNLLRKEYWYANEHKRVCYHLKNPTQDWIRVNGSLVDDNLLSSSAKALLVLLKMQCLNNTNITYYSKTKLSQLCRVDPKTFRKHLKELEDQKHIIVHQDSIQIISVHIPLDDPKIFKEIVKAGESACTPSIARCAEIINRRSKNIRHLKNYLRRIEAGVRSSKSIRKTLKKYEF